MSNRATTQLHDAPVTTAVNDVTDTRSSSAVSRRLDTMLPSWRLSSTPTPTVRPEAASQRDVLPPAATQQLNRLVENIVMTQTQQQGSDDAQAASSDDIVRAPPAADVIRAADNHVPDHNEDARDAAALTATAQAVVRQSTAAAGPLILASTGNVEEMGKQ